MKKNYYGYKSPIKVIVAFVDRLDEKVKFVDFTEAIRKNNYNSLADDYILSEYNILTMGAKRKAVQKQEANNKKSIKVFRWLC